MAGSAPHIPGCRDLSLIGERVARSLYSAYSEAAGRQVTVTVYPPLSEGRTREGFDTAAATAQRLGAHPSVLTIHDWGHAPDGRPWIVTDPQPAESVDTLLTLDGPLEVERALQVGVLLAGALETAHRAGILHGDLQPARLVFGVQGEPLVVESGLAPFAVFPGLGALNNPVRYHAPPEVLERTEVSPATDVYSLATTVYAMLAGRAPHQKPAEVTDSNASLLLRILQMPVPRIERPGLPAGLDEALAGPLSASPGKRPQQAIEVAWLLQDVQRRNGLAVTEPVVLELDGRKGAPATATAPTAEPARRPDVTAAVAGAAATGVEPTWPGDVGHGPGDAWAAPAASPDAWSAAPEPTPPQWEEPEPPTPTIFPFADGLPGGLGAAAAAAGAAPVSGDPFAPPLDSVGTAASPWAPADPATPTESNGAAASPWAPAEPSTSNGAAAAPWAPADPATPTGSNGAVAWPSTWPATPPASDDAAPLWPSSWPADQAGDGDLPAWASTPVTDDEHGLGDPPAVDREHGREHSPALDGEHGLADPPDDGQSTDPLADGHGVPGPDPSAGRHGIADPDDTDPGPRRGAHFGPTSGDDGGSIDDATELAPGSGPAGAGFDAPPFSDLGALDRPPELDELPSWYTDPLPNQPGGPPPGADAGPGASASPWGAPADPADPAPSPWADEHASGEPSQTADQRAIWPSRLDETDTSSTGWPGGREQTDPGPVGGAGIPAAPDGNGNGSGWADPGAHTAPWAPSGDGATAPTAPTAPSTHRLPGAGDELRSLFGEVVSGDGNGAPPALGAGPGTEPVIEPRRAPDDDPLGPPEARPPIDLSQLDRPLGPAPYLPGRSAADAGGVDTASPASPTRLPRRGEAQTWVSPAARGQAADPPRVVPDADPPPRARTPRPAPRQVAPKPGMPSGTPGSAATAGPPALPLIILVAVVAVLALGVAWLVVNGDDGGEPASDRRASEAAAGPSEVEVNEVPDGIQVTWTGDADASYIVTVLSGEAPPEALPATIGTSALVPNVEGAAAGPRCFTVTAADEAGAATGDATSPVCTDGATPDQMQQG